MTVLRLALADMRHFASTRIGRLTLIALVLVPSGYGGLYLYANEDPYSRLSDVPAALVVEDVGTTLENGERLDSGNDVAGELLRSRTLGWSRVDRARAEQGLAVGDYNVVLTLPRTFSADLASSATDRPRQAEFVIRTDDGNGYLARTIADALVDEVSARVAQQVSRTSTGRLLNGFSQIRATVLTGADGARRLATGAGDLSAGADRLAAGQVRLASGAGRLSDGSNSLARGLDDLRSETANLPGQTTRLADGARRVADGNADVAASAGQVAARADDLAGDVSAARARVDAELRSAGLSDAQIRAVLGRFDAASGAITAANAELRTNVERLDELATGADQVADGTARLAAAAPGLRNGVDRAADGSAELARGAGILAAGEQRALGGARALAVGATRLGAGARDLAVGLDEGAAAIPALSPAQRTVLAQTISSPIAVDHQAQTQANSFAAGLAPFLLGLSLWIGGFALLTRLPGITARALAAGHRRWHSTVRGWLVPALLGALQAVLALAVAGPGIGVDVAHPLLLVGFLLVVSAAFVAIVHALVSRLGDVGQLIALVLFLLQLVVAGGTFPWQTLPESLQPLHHGLPMSYAVDGIRRLMYGGELSTLWLDVTVLVGWGAGALVVGAFATRRRAKSGLGRHPARASTLDPWLEPSPAPSTAASRRFVSTARRSSTP